MHNILVLGAGKIGTLISCLLADSGDYQVTLADLEIDQFNPEQLGSAQNNIRLVKLNAQERSDLVTFFSKEKLSSVVSCLPYYCNVNVAELAKEHNLNYFDLTEDTKVTDAISELAKDAKSAFVPQSGLAPGFISIAANSLMKNFDKVNACLMRVGALPEHPNNALKYSLTWSTDGLINEYGNVCYGIVNGEEAPLQPLGGLETIEVDGLLYEAFNTSGGLGSLASTYEGKVQTMNYKTLRYPGHCEKVRLLMNDLRLNEDRDTLKRVLENSIPQTKQDVVLVYVAVNGQQGGRFMEESFVKKIYPMTICSKKWSAIQVTTASGLCAVVDKVHEKVGRYHGLVKQEDFDLSEILQNRFGKNYAE